MREQAQCTKSEGQNFAANRQKLASNRQNWQNTATIGKKTELGRNSREIHTQQAAEIRVNRSGQKFTANRQNFASNRQNLAEPCSHSEKPA